MRRIFYLVSVFFKVFAFSCICIFWFADFSNVFAQDIETEDGAITGSKSVPPEEPPAPESSGSNEGRKEEVSTAPITADEKPPVQVVTVEPAKPLEAVTKRHEKLFGSYRLRIAAAKPAFDDGYKCYDKFYGSPKVYPTVAVDWFAFDWYATVGFGGRVGIYSAKGHAATSSAGSTNKDCSKLVTDDNGPTTLFLFPMQLLMTAEFTPFRQKWIVIDFWGGVERLYFSETREQESTGKKTAITRIMATDGTGTSTSSGTSSATESPGSYTNRGWKTSSVVGVAANILLNPLDQTSVKSMNKTLNVGYVYLSPYLEVVSAMRTKAVDFGRTSYGLMFTFETLY